MGFPSKNTEVGCYFLLQGIFPIYVSSVSCIGRWVLYHWETRRLLHTLWRAICGGGWGVWAETRWVIGRQILEGDWGCIPSLLITLPKLKPHQPLFVWSRSCGWQSGRWDSHASYVWLWGSSFSSVYLLNLTVSLGIPESPFAGLVLLSGNMVSAHQSAENKLTGGKWDKGEVNSCQPVTAFILAKS